MKKVTQKVHSELAAMRRERKGVYDQPRFKVSPQAEESKSDLLADRLGPLSEPKTNKLPDRFFEKQPKLYYGEHWYTALSATWPKVEAQLSLYQHAAEIESTYNGLRESIKYAIRDLKEADEVLERNVNRTGCEHALLQAVNTCGILQGRALDIDGGVRKLEALLSSFARLQRVVEEK